MTGGGTLALASDPPLSNRWKPTGQLIPKWTAVVLGVGPHGSRWEQEGWEGVGVLSRETLQSAAGPANFHLWFTLGLATNRISRRLALTFGQQDLPVHHVFIGLPKEALAG